MARAWSDPPIWITGEVTMVDRDPHTGHPRIFLKSPSLEDGQRFLGRDELILPFVCSAPTVELISAGGKMRTVPFGAIRVGARVAVLVTPEFTVAGHGGAFRLRVIEP